MHFLLLCKLTAFPDTKQQPLLPVNPDLLAHLRLVENASDPWLLFLYVLNPRRFQDSIVFMIATCRKALFLRRLSRREEAIESALLSIASYPWNWATWILLSECMDDGEEVCRPDDDGGEADVSSLQLSALLPLLPLPPTHPVVQMFQIKTLNTLNNPSENELGLCDKLLHEDRFPRSLWIMSLRACVLYHLHGRSSHRRQHRCSHR